MGNLSADGKWLWLSGRYDGVIYAFNTDDGSVKTIPVGGMPPRSLDLAAGEAADLGMLWALHPLHGVR